MRRKVANTKSLYDFDDQLNGIYTLALGDAVAQCSEIGPHCRNALGGFRTIFPFGVVMD